MKETKELKANNGITLIALVITIIVMMLLVGVTISMAVNGGLFTKAGEATGQMNNALKAEQELANGRINVAGVWYDSIDAYFAGNKSTVAPTSITISGDTSVKVRQKITLKALNQENQEISSEEIDWTSSNPTVATVSNGVVSGGSIAEYYFEDGTSTVTVTVTAKYKKNNTIVAQKQITVSSLECPCCERRRKA